MVVVGVDRFTKMVPFIGLETSATAKDVADTFLKEVWKLHRLPSEIISDMDAKLSGEFWESLCKSLGIKRKMATAYHPQKDGQTERTNPVREGYLRNFVNYDQNDWYQLLLLAEYAYNNSKASAYKLTPFSPTPAFILKQNGWNKETCRIQEWRCILIECRRFKTKQERHLSRLKKRWKKTMTSKRHHNQRST